VALPESFIAHLRREGYHPRSDKHSNALAAAIVQDLVSTCEPIADAGRRGALVYQINFDLQYGNSTWNVDLVLGRPPPGLLDLAQERGAIIERTDPSTVLIAIELKSIMTEHKKAAKNRKRDLEAHHEHVHNYDPKAIAGGVFVVNAAERFRSPTRRPGDITTHRDPLDKVEHCLSELRNVSVRGGPTGTGLDAKAGLVVDMDNMDLESTSYLVNTPAPRVGDPMHYDAFIQRLCAEYTSRHG